MSPDVSATIAFTGRVAPGKGVAVGFTTADWARRAFISLVGIDPYPGTLNLVVEEGADLAAWTRLRATPGLRMAAPDPAWCDGRLYRVSLPTGIAAAIVMPEVASYDPRQVELIAAVRLREALALDDGDVLLVTAAVGAR